MLTCALFATVLFQAQAGDWQDSFAIEKKALVSAGANPFFILEPGYKLELAGGDTRLVITVLDKTEMVDGVVTRVVEERETENGKLVEISRNFFAIAPISGDVYYFGEDVDIYENGKVVSHEGAWRSGTKGAKFGLIMPGKVTAGRAYYQEIAPKVAMDRARIVSLNETVTTPAGKFPWCLKIEETTPLEANAREYKLYAKGIGLVQDGELKLVKLPK